MLILLLTLPLVWAAIPITKTYCEPSTLVPPLDSCERVLIFFGNFVRNAAANNWTFGPHYSDANLKMPWAVMDPGPGDANENRCTIVVDWDTQPWFPRPPLPPPVTLLNEFWANDFEELASRIMEKCIRKVSPEGLRQVGHEWIEFVELIRVEYLSGFPPGVAGHLITGASDWTNGTNMTFSASMVHEGSPI